jgi:uncharacterized membrane protein YjfL (UPF0719 family)
MITAAVMAGVFLGIYEALRRGASRRSGIKPAVRWGWLAAIVGLVAVVVLVGALSRG